MFLGTDSAPHAVENKESKKGCAGCFSEFLSLELYAEIFEKNGCLDKLEAFASYEISMNDWVIEKMVLTSMDYRGMRIMLS